MARLFPELADTFSRFPSKGKNLEEDLMFRLWIDGKARKVFEAERKPNSQRNIKREEEYKKLGIKQETHKAGN